MCLNDQKHTKNKKPQNSILCPPKPPLGREPRVGEGIFAFSTNAARPQCQRAGRPQCQRHFVVKGKRRGAGKVLTLLRWLEQYILQACRAAALSENAKARNEGEMTGMLEIGSRHHLLLKVMKLAWAMPRVF